jgi:hypothetical protein
LIIALLLPFTQPAILRKDDVERLWRAGEIDQALVYLNSHERWDFPRTWEPHYTFEQTQFKNGWLPALEMALERPLTPWVRAFLLSTLERWLEVGLSELEHYRSFDECVESADITRAAAILAKQPEGPAIAARLAPQIEAMLKEEGASRAYADGLVVRSKWPNEECMKEALERLLEVAGKPDR